MLLLVARVGIRPGPTWREHGTRPRTGVAPIAEDLAEFNAGSRRDPRTARHSAQWIITNFRAISRPRRAPLDAEREARPEWARQGHAKCVN
jgi:hypothetical protein